MIRFNQQPRISLISIYKFSKTHSIFQIKFTATNRLKLINRVLKIINNKYYIGKKYNYSHFVSSTQMAHNPNFRFPVFCSAKVMVSRVNKMRSIN